MDRDKALKLLQGGKDGIRAWNYYRRKGGIFPSLEGADLVKASLVGADLSGVYPRRANLTRTNFSGANLGSLLGTE